MKNQTQTKTQINQPMLDKVLASIPEDKHEALRNCVQAMNDMVNHIEHSGRPQTTQHYYGDYLPLIKTKTDYVLYKIAGAGPGASAVAMLNGWTN